MLVDTLLVRCNLTATRSLVEALASSLGGKWLDTCRCSTHISGVSFEYDYSRA